MKLKIAVAMLAASALLAGCSKTQETTATDDEKARAAKAAEIVKDPEAAARKIGDALKKGDLTALSTAKTGGGQLDCDTLVPASVREKYMAGATMSAGSMAGRTLMCSANKDGALAYHVTYDCRTTTKLPYFEAKKKHEQEISAERKDIPGLGRGAFGSDTSLTFFDDDADCLVTVATYNEQKTAVEIAKELSAILTPALLPEAPKTKYALDCDKLLPQPLRDQHVPGGTVTAESSMTDSMECKVSLPKFETASVNYSCGRAFEPGFVKEMKAQYDQRKMAAEEIAVGAAGLYFSMFGSHSVTFIDAETSCMVNVMQTKGTKDKTVAFAKAVEQALTADSAK